MIMVKMVIWTLLEGFRMSLNILFCFCRSILHVNVFTLHVIQVQQKLRIHQQSDKIMAEPPSFAFKEVDDRNFSDETLPNHNTPTNVFGMCFFIGEFLS